MPSLLAKRARGNGAHPMRTVEGNLGHSPKEVARTSLDARRLKRHSDNNESIVMPDPISLSRTVEDQSGPIPEDERQ